MATQITFRATDEDEQIIEAARHGDESTTDVLRRALKLLDREAWLEQARADAARLRDEDLNEEEDAW
jgi:antitoxin ParD1/3/4